MRSAELGMGQRTLGGGDLPLLRFWSQNWRRVKRALLRVDSRRRGGNSRSGKVSGSKGREDVCRGVCR